MLPPFLNKTRMFLVVGFQVLPIIPFAGGREDRAVIYPAAEQGLARGELLHSCSGGALSSLGRDIATPAPG